MKVSEMKIEGDLSGQVALVTGGGRGIGRAISQRLAAAGAYVAVMARTAHQVTETVALIEAEQGCAKGFAVDVTDQASVEQMVREIEQTLGAVDLLVNNAAIAQPFGPMWEVDPEAWWRCQQINLLGSFLCARAVVPSMIARRQGRVVNVASIGGTEPIGNASAYAVSKAALIRFSENLAEETKPYGIKVFAIHPGDVITAMAEEFMSEENATWLPWAREYFTEIDLPVSQAADLVLWLALGHGDALSGCFISVYEDVEQMAERAEVIQSSQLYTLRLST
jgi:NAD(P)-dependent dehydrogenase (short-subunit alcohol dehydrogenase family)